jgi:hypothetical protein
MHVARQRRVGEVLAVGQKVVGVLLEKERRLAARVMAHLDRVVGIVAADAIDPADRKPLGGAFDGQEDRLGRGMTVAVRT